MKTIGPGSLVYYDAYTCGLIPCRVLSISGLDLSCPNTSVRCTLQVTARGNRYFRYGEILEGRSGLDVWHRGSMHYRKYGTTCSSDYDFVAGSL